MDLVGTCAKAAWKYWISEGDCAGTADTGIEYRWFTNCAIGARINVGDRFYVVAHGRLRGYAPVTQVIIYSNGRTRMICRRGGGVACTIEEKIPGFRGLRKRWWSRNGERAFTHWKTEGVS